MSSVPLYEIALQHRDLSRLATEEDIDPQTLSDTLEGLVGNFDEKAKSVAMFIGNLEADAEAIANAAKAMQARAKRLTNRAEAVRTYLKINMEACGFTKISCPWFTITLRKNPPRVEVYDEPSIPDAYRVWPEPPPPTIDKRALLDVLKTGAEVPGARLAQDNRVEIRS